MILGPHLSIAGGYQKAVKEAISIGANAFQFFTRNPRGGRAKALDAADIARAKELMNGHSFGPLLAHAPYTLNLASEKETVRTFGREMMADDLERMSTLPAALYNFHPGSHTGQGVEKGIEWIVRALGDLLDRAGETTLLLETMSGKGTEIGRTFEELRAIIDGLDGDDRIGVCLDTCHVYAAGYDIVEDLDGVVETFDRIIGLDRLRAIHLNDSMKPFDSRKDRHARLGEGELGEAALFRVVQHPKLAHLPFYLETPNELDGYEDEIKRLRAAIKRG